MAIVAMHTMRRCTFDKHISLGNDKTSEPCEALLHVKHPRSSPRACHGRNDSSPSSDQGSILPLLR